MGAQSYKRVPGSEAEVPPTPYGSQIPSHTPASPPPSFRSRASSTASRRHILRGSAGINRTLEETFGSGNDSDNDDENEIDDRQRLIRNAGPGFSSSLHANSAPVMRQSSNESTHHAPPISVFSRNGYSGNTFTSHPSSNDGVFANLNAKPEHGEKLEEQPPSYEQAAADATPPYWETTILAPGMVSDEVYIDGLPVGSFFSFAWNGIISMAFQLVGFLLTYLLHTTHAARNGSRAGLGVTLINYGFTMRGLSYRGRHDAEPNYSQPSAPNSHKFDPSSFSNPATATAGAMADSHRAPESSKNYPAGEWLAYLLMIVGWIILIKAVTDFVKARRHEQLILQSPDRGLHVPVVAEGETEETVV